MLSFLQLLLSTALYTSIVKLAAFLYRRARLSWRDACIFSLILLMVLGTGTLLNRLSGDAVPLSVSILAGMIIQVGIGAWYLAPRATTASGEALGPKGGALLALIAYILVAGFGLLAATLLSALRAA